MTRQTSRRRTSRKLGSGSRFAALVHKLQARGDIADPRALAASIGRRKYGSRRFQQLAAAGRRQTSLRRNSSRVRDPVVQARKYGFPINDGGALDLRRLQPKTPSECKHALEMLRAELDLFRGRADDTRRSAGERREASRRVWALNNAVERLMKHTSLRRNSKWDEPGYYLDHTNRCVYHIDGRGEEREVTEYAEDWNTAIGRIWDAQRAGEFGVDEAERLTELCNENKNLETRRRAKAAGQVSEWAAGWGAVEAQKRKLRRNPNSTDPTVVEYAMQYLFKKKSISAAAKMTAKKLSGATNYFIDGGRTVVSIDTKKLEDAIYERIVDKCLTWLASTAKGHESSVLLGAANHYEQMSSPEWKPGWGPNEKFVKELRKRIIARLGHDPFQVQPNRRHL